MQDKPIPYKRRIPRSTWILAGVSIGLAALTAVAGWVAWQYTPAPEAASIAGANVQLALPGLGQSGNSSDFSAKSVLVFDIDNDSIVFENGGFDRRPIASITKLMTAMVALDHGIAWDNEADILPQEYVAGGQLLLHPGERASMRDLVAASLVGSANNATLAYVRALGIPTEEFVRQMNRKAISFGLEQTEFTDVTGLDPSNVSTAYEVARLAEVAFTQYPVIAELTSLSGYDFIAKGSGREHTIKNTNKLISDWGEVLSGSKTGYLYEAEYCLVVRGSGTAESRIAVVLGSPSEFDHFNDITRLLRLAGK